MTRRMIHNVYEYHREEVCSVRSVADDDWPGVGGGAFHHGGAAEMQRRKSKLAIFYVVPPIFSPFKTYCRRGFAFFSEIYWVYLKNVLACL